MAIGMLEHHRETLGNASEADLLHYQIEALRLAFADAQEYIADPTMADVPVEGMLDDVIGRQGDIFLYANGTTMNDYVGTGISRLSLQTH